MNLLLWGFLAAIVAITGALGLQFVFTQLQPTAAAKGLMFALLFITFAAVTIPPSAYFNHRFGAKNWRRRDPYRLLRHGFEAGLLVVLLAYLQLIRALDWTIAAVLAGVFIFMETFYLTRG